MLMPFFIQQFIRLIKSIYTPKLGYNVTYYGLMTLFIAFCAYLGYHLSITVEDEKGVQSTCSIKDGCYNKK